ncbi:hypothetical protein GCM10028798_05750 [Humibacter antri]
MSEEGWRPLGVETDEDVASYDALHDGIPAWMDTPYWLWVQGALTQIRTFGDGSGRIPMLNVELAEDMCQTLRIPLPDLRAAVGNQTGRRQLAEAIAILRKHPMPLQVADYLLAYNDRADHAALGELLWRSNSAWKVAERAGRTGLVRRVAVGVQTAGDSVIARSGQAGIHLAQAWQELFGLDGSSSEAYRLAILAIEDAAVPVVSPANGSATLGTVLKQIEDQADWQLPMGREHSKSPSGDVVVSLMRLVWHGQHDRHGGQPSAPGAVTPEEARVAVTTAVVLVDWFTDRLVERHSPATGDAPA